MKFLYYKVLTAVAVVMLLSGCENEKPIPLPETPPAERVFLMYDNIGNVDFSNDVAEAGAAVAAGALDGDERVVVFRRGAYGTISELVKDSSAPNGYEEKILKRYEAGEASSLDKATIARVVGDIRTTVPADHYGFAFGSHGKGWVPKVNPAGLRSAPAEYDTFLRLWDDVPEHPLTRYFSGYGEKLDVSEFIDALDEWDWDFMILDDCFMASIEALYDMRGLADYIIASPTEIMIMGFPYDRVVETVFGNWSETGFKQVGEEFFDYYNNLSRYPYGTIAVVKMSELDALAASVRAIRLGGGYREPDAATAAAMQTYEKLPTHYYYDFNQYIEYWSQNSSLYAQFAAQLERTVIYKGHTEMFPSAVPDNNLRPMPIAPEHYSGINAFIPTSATARLTPLWEQTEWYKAVYAE